VKKSSVLLSALMLSMPLIADDTASLKKEGVGYIKMLAKALKSELKSHMKNDLSGIEALAFCTGSAEEITKRVNEKLPPYASVRRTALKVRNDKNNLPDKTDSEVMRSFQEMIDKKTLTDKTIKVVRTEEGARIYKPLVTKKVCLKCHGAQLSEKIAESLKSAYPHDKAVGFKEGDLRGVIVAEIKKSATEK